VGHVGHVGEHTGFWQRIEWDMWHMCGSIQGSGREVTGTCGTCVGAYRVLAENHEGKVLLGKTFVMDLVVL
jgi:DnaJ-class molecular chaperone